jgi:Kef-type K+ transport system membrane component KefB
MLAESHFPVLLVLLVAVAGPLLAEIPVGFRVPAVVLEVVLGIIIGPQVLGLVHFNGLVASMFTFGMAATLFMAGMELEFARIRGRPLRLALVGWGISLALGLTFAALLHASSLHDPMIVALALTTTALGTLLPILRDANQLDTPFGRLFIAAGSIGELGPIVVMSLLLSQQYTTLQEFGFLMVFLVIVIFAAAISLGLRPPRLLALLGRTMHASSQLPVRFTLLLFAAFFVLSERFGFESILGAFAAGMVVGLATQGTEGKAPRMKIDAIFFGWFIPFFFVGTGIKFDLGSITASTSTMLLVPISLALFLLVRGAPVMLYRTDLTAAERASFALYSSVASLSLIVVITEIGVRGQTMSSQTASGLIAAGILSVLLFPTIAGHLLRQQKSRSE